MKAIHWIIAAAAFAFVQAAPASAGVNDPEIFIYRGAGINDTGGAAFSGNATAFLCTNFSGATENIRVVVRNRSTYRKNWRDARRRVVRLFLAAWNWIEPRHVQLDPVRGGGVSVNKHGRTGDIDRRCRDGHRAL